MREAQQASPRGGREFSRVIVVDDSRLERERNFEILRRLGDEVQIELCASGDEALLSLAREHADLVVSDLTMPGMSGLELLAHLRREHPKTEFILITGNASIETAIGALRMGAADYLRKPIQADELALVVSRTLARRKLIRENARLHEMMTTVEACRVLASCVTAAEIDLACLEIAANALGAKRGLAYRAVPRAEHGDALTFYGFSDGEAVKLRSVLRGKDRIAKQDFLKLAVVVEGALHEACDEAGIALGRVLSVPLEGSDGSFSVIWVEQDEASPFDDDALEKVRIVVGNANLALLNAERFSRAQEKAFVDDVTELYNARYLSEAINRELHRAERYGQQLSVLFLDVDRFKLVNDRYGHLVGSQVLREIAGLLLQCVRQVDTVARFGGDEFTMLLVDTGFEGALSVAERVRRSIEEHVFFVGDGAGLRISISIGVATFPQHAQSREVLLDLADRAMYVAKREGRNRTCSAEEVAG